MRTLDAIAQDLAASQVAYTRAQTHFCTDAQFARVSDRHFDLLAEYNAVAKAEGKPLYHQPACPHGRAK
jgi:hypothetical protein